LILIYHALANIFGVHLNIVADILNEFLSIEGEAVAKEK